AVVGVNLFNPFCKEEFLKVLPKSAKIITVLDRTKQCGSPCEELAKNVIACLWGTKIKVLCGRYGLGGKDFNLGMAKAVFENMKNEQKNHFTVGIIDDVQNSSLSFDKNEKFEDNIKKIAFYGVGNDGTVSASKLYSKLIQKNNNNLFVSGNCYYDSKKSGNLTESQIFESDKKFEINYKENNFDFVVISNIDLLNKYNIFQNLKQNATILINSDKNLNEHLSPDCKNAIASKNCKLFFVDANKIAKDNNLGNKTNLIMLASFIKLSSDNPNELLTSLKIEATKQYSLSADYLDMEKIEVNRFIYPSSWKNINSNSKFFDAENLPVSAFKANGEFENVNTFEVFGKEKACWLENKCIKCTNCAQICPHNAIKIKIVNSKDLENAPKDFKSINNSDGTSFCLFVDTKICTGCGNCTQICPTKALTLNSYSNTNKQYFESLKPILNNRLAKNLAKGCDYYNCNSSCSGCMEIMYFKLLGNMFGSHLNLINATGCSSIYNAGINCSPFSSDDKGFGTNFVSNLFEDNAEFGYGLSTMLDTERKNFIQKITQNCENFSEFFKKNAQKFIENSNDFEICQNIYFDLKNKTPENIFDQMIAENLELIIPVVNFIVGGDGWAYDIDFGGIDHVVSMNKNVNILILDNEIYSNTGGQTSKATNLGAKTKYTGEKQTTKKDLFLSLFQYKNLNFYKVDFSANKNQCIKAFNNAVNHNGPSVIVAYTPCINHKIDMKNSIKQAQNAVKSGYFNLISYENGKLSLDSEPNFNLLENFVLSEGRYKNISPKALENLINSKKDEYKLYKKLSDILK
ncbi:MAG: 2-oxoacid:acceptor oxidoreductase family protein, partial [Christensenellales bacterium]